MEGIRVAQTIRPVRIFQPVTQVKRHGRHWQEDRVRAETELVNRLIDARTND